MSVSPRLVIFPTDNTYLLGTCSRGLVKKERPVCIATSWKAVIVPVHFFPLGYTIYNCVSNMHLKITYKTTLFKVLGGRITQTFEIVKLFSKIQAQIWHRQIQFHLYNIYGFFSSCRSANRRDWEKKNNDNICSNISF